MKTTLFIVSALVVLVWLWLRSKPPSRTYGVIDAIVPAFNEEVCITITVEDLVRNPYIARVIVVNDGSTDGTRDILDALAARHDKVLAIHQANTGKGGAIMNGVGHATAPYVFLTDADTAIPHDSDGLGYLIAELEDGADAAGGIPASDLKGAGLLPHLRATLKLPMITLQRTFQQIMGGAPFLISGACGLFKTEVIRAVPFSDRTKVEDLDLTWTLVSKGYKVRQSNRCIVYSQECNSLASEWLRWRRWIVGYAVCMRLHPRLLASRYGLFSILPIFVIPPLGIAVFTQKWAAAIGLGALHHLPLSLFPLLWVTIVCVLAIHSAVHHRRLALIPLAPFAVFYVIFAYAIWLIHGFPGLLSGREPNRDKPKRYTHVVA